MKMLSFIGMNLLFTAVFYALFRLRSKRPQPAERLQMLRYPWLIRILAAVGVSLFMSGLVFVCLHTAGSERWFCLAMAAPFVLLVLSGAIEVYLYEISYDEGCISRSSPWSGMIQIGIEEVTGITYSCWWDQYVIHTRTGKPIRVSKYLSGTEGFISFINTALVEACRDDSLKS